MLPKTSGIHGLESKPAVHFKIKGFYLMLKINKSEVLNDIAEELGYDIGIVEKTVDAFLCYIKVKLKQNCSVSLKGFGIFEPKEFKERKAHDINTSEQLMLEKRFLPKFYFAKSYVKEYKKK